MSKLPIRDMQGRQSGEYELSDELLVHEKGGQAVHDAVVAYLANQRQGSASTLDKGEVSGSNKKPWKQKGTGRARAGFRQSPVWRGGGTAFGPKPRSYRKELNRKVIKLAFRRAVSEKVASGEITVLEQLNLPEAKTRHFSGMLKQLEMTRGALVIVKETDAGAILASRNLPRVEIATASNVNVYQMMRYPQILVTREAMPGLEARLETAVRRGA